MVDDKKNYIPFGLENNEDYIENDISVSDFEIDINGFSIEEDFDPKTIKYLERQIRSSYEYREYINYLKNELNLTTCALMPGIDVKELKVSLEFHHFPITLFDIVSIVGKKMISTLEGDDTISAFEISSQVVKEHYENNIGLVPLTKTMHDMAHNQTVIIPISAVNGNYTAFLEKYKNYIDADIFSKVTDIEVFSESEESKDFNTKKLSKKISKLNVQYTESDDIDISSFLEEDS